MDDVGKGIATGLSKAKAFGLAMSAVCGLPPFTPPDG
jgi:hypothetical protein